MFVITNCNDQRRIHTNPDQKLAYKKIKSSSDYKLDCLDKPKIHLNVNMNQYPVRFTRRNLYQKLTLFSGQQKAEQLTQPSFDLENSRIKWGCSSLRQSLRLTPNHTLQELKVG